MKKSSQDDVLDDWGGLLREARENEAELAGVAPFLDALESAHAQAHDAKRLKDSLYASAQDATQRMYQAFAAGADAASRLRNFIKSVLGSRTDELLRYGITPRRGRGRSVCGCRRPG